MKITLEKLRQIITEEVIKEELAPEIAAPAIAAMLQGTESVATSDIFGAVFDEMYGEGALEAEAERQASAGEAEEEEFPTEYQPGGTFGDRPQMGFEESLSEIIEEELDRILDEAHGEAPQNLSPERQIAAVRAQVGGMSYEIEKMLVALLKAGYSPADIINMAIQIKKMDLHPEDVQVAEEKEKDNPWAICTASVGREDKDKYEKCVKSVKKEKGIK
tara:strand:+ start:1157 stop:1810 length:654 start_codon:yes stop_codon:yes gene_type:complete